MPTDDVGSRAEKLRQRIVRAEAELQNLRSQLDQIEAEETRQREQVPGNGPDPVRRWPLQEEEYQRYSRQLILPSVGVEGGRWQWIRCF